MQKPFTTGLVWLRRDLRLDDNPALEQALQECAQVFVAFVFDRTILDPLPRQDRRVDFIHASLVELDQALRGQGAPAEAGLITLHDDPRTAIPALAQALQAHAVYFAHDYEPQALARDHQVSLALQHVGIRSQRCTDHVLCPPEALRTQGGKPYTVFTPYKKAWLQRLAQTPPQYTATPPSLRNLAPRPPQYRRAVPDLTELGFTPSNLGTLRLPTGMQGGQQLLTEFTTRMDRYDSARDFPALKGPSYLGVHFRFGTVSIRQAGALAWQAQQDGSTGAATWLSELAWRDFYFQIVFNFPHVAEGAFRPEYDAIIWESGAPAEALFAAWCAGRTGYPLVDAAMHQLNQTGYMHNRLRMVAGSFLVKHLGLDWRWGERYFAQQLNDFDLAANNGGWQWVSSSGCDAQPYFRIFNPITQSEKFDAEGAFIQRYLPVLQGLGPRHIHAPWTAPAATLQAAGIELGTHYPHPIVDHATARAATLERYSVVRKTGETRLA